MFLDFSTLECRHLSESVELFVLDLMNATANYTDREVKVRYTEHMYKISEKPCARLTLTNLTLPPNYKFSTKPKFESSDMKLCIMKRFEIVQF